MNDKQKAGMEKVTGKAVRILFAIFVMVISICVLSDQVSKMECMTSAIESLDQSRERVMVFSGATLAASTAISLLPDDWATPLANSLADMNKYFLFIFAILFLERLLVIEGVKISFVYVIPIACILYILFVLFQKEKMKEWAIRFLVLGISLVAVIPFSIHFTEMISQDYMAYIDETIEEANAGAGKIYEMKSGSEDEASFSDKVLQAFRTALQGVKDLFTYFNDLIKKCTNSIAIMIVITFILPLCIFIFFKWLLKELFSLNLNISVPKVKIPAVPKIAQNETKIEEE